MGVGGGTALILISVIYRIEYADDFVALRCKIRPLAVVAIWPHRTHFRCLYIYFLVWVYTDEGLCLNEMI